MLAKLKSEVRLREPESWYNVVDKNGDKSINATKLTAHLAKIMFSDKESFWVELRKRDEEFKA